MIKQGFIIDLNSYTIEKDCMYDDKRVDGMYVKVDNSQLLPAAYVFPIEHKLAIIEQLERIKTAKKAFDDITADVYYKQFPKYRS